MFTDLLGPMAIISRLDPRDQPYLGSAHREYSPAKFERKYLTFQFNLVNEFSEL
jgi:hypothetical protein